MFKEKTLSILILHSIQYISLGLGRTLVTGLLLTTAMSTASAAAEDRLVAEKPSSEFSSSETSQEDSGAFESVAEQDIDWGQVAVEDSNPILKFSSSQTPQPSSASSNIIPKRNADLRPNLVMFQKTETGLNHKTPPIIAQKDSSAQTDSSLVGGKTFSNTHKLRQELLIAQTPSPDPNAPSDSELRQRLKIKPLLTTAGAKPTYPPSLSFGIPSAFGANWGDFFLGASGATRKVGNEDTLDGSISAGFGLGDSQQSIGLEVAYNNGSIKNLGANGTFDLKAHRVVYASSRNQIAAAVGWNTFAQYGTEAVADSTVYGAVTNVSVLQPNNPQNKMPLAVTLGLGGGNFRSGNDSIGVFAGVGLQVHPQVGIGASWSGVALNAGVSFVPVPTIPLTIVLQGSDLTDRTPGGTAVILSLSYGFNFLPK